MLEPKNNDELPAIPGKRYFTIGEVSDLCGVKPHVLRYWEQEFPQLKPVKRRGNRRYYQRHDVLMVRQIRSLLYEQGYTIGGARLRLDGDGKKGNREAQRADGERIHLFPPEDNDRRILSSAEGIRSADRGVTNEAAPQTMAGVFFRSRMADASRSISSTSL